MADGLEILGAVDASVDLFKLAYVICRKVGRYFGDVRNAPSHIQELRKELLEVEHLKNALSEEFDKAETDNLKIAFDGHMNQLHIILKELDKRTAPGQERGRAKWVWPLKQAETEQFTRKLEVLLDRLGKVSNSNRRYEFLRLIQRLKLQSFHPQ